MWRDVRINVTQQYTDLFHGFEREGFDVGNDWHKFTLQYMFMTRIQQNLDDFKSIWNNHPIASEHNRTPIQLILLGRNKIDYTDPLDLINFNIELFQKDVMDDDNILNNIRQVTCNSIVCPLNPANLALLKQRILPLTKHTPENQLSNWFFAALRIVLDLRDTQLE
jgi:hypothetical protein